MGIKAEAEQAFALPWNHVYQTVIQVVPTVKKMQVRWADPTTGRIMVNKGMSWKSWGEEIVVDVFQPAEGQTVVKVHSQVKAQLMDWGANKANVQSILSAVSAALGATPAPQA